MGETSSPEGRDAPIECRTGERLSGHTTLELGGPAACFALVASRRETEEALRWAASEGLPVRVLGGGSNLVVADRGVDGLVLAVCSRGIERRPLDRWELVEVAAGEPWADVVAWSVDEGLAGLECLAGIPGTAGATPIQNVGAYGREVAELVEWVEVLDRRRLEVSRVPVGRCGFGYRRSRFRERPDEQVVLRVGFRLLPGGDGVARYPELRRKLGDPVAAPSPRAVMEAVLELRRSKSMVLDPADPNRRSVGSFFVNPVLGADRAAGIAARAVADGHAGSVDEVLCFPAEAGAVKLSAAWLIERAGFPRGTRRGPVGVSSAHSLALVHHGGGSTAELLALAGEIRRRVDDVFGVRLVPEPVLWGFDRADPLGPGQSSAL